MDNSDNGEDYVKEAINMGNGNVQNLKNIPKNSGSLSNSGKAHVSIIGIIFIYILVIPAYVGLSIIGLIIGLGYMTYVILGIIMGLFAIWMYPSLTESGYTVSGKVYLFIFFFLLSIIYLSVIFLGGIGGIVGLMLVTLALYLILSNNNLIG